MKAAPWKVRFTHALRNARIPQSSGAQSFTEHDLRAFEEAAYERGRREGEKALNEQLMRQRAELVDLQHGVLAALRQAVPQVIRETEHTLAQLALEVANKLVAGMPLSADQITASVREAIAQVEEHTDYHIYLHPEDLELLRRANSALLESRPGPETMFFHPAPEVSRGGCLVRTQFGLVDGQRETKLELIKKSLAA